MTRHLARLSFKPKVLEKEFCGHKQSSTDFISNSRPWNIVF